MNSSAQPSLEMQAASAGACRLTTDRVIASKRILLGRYRLQGVPMDLARAAIAAAEAKAWLSGFPHLFLPDLADEILAHLLQKHSAIPAEYAQAA